MKNGRIIAAPFQTSSSTANTTTTNGSNSTAGSTIRNVKYIDFRNFRFKPLEKLTDLEFSKYCGPTPESNWVIPGILLVGAYPASQDDNETFELITSILKLGIRKFVCLQQEYRAGISEDLWRKGLALRPYYEDVQKIVKNKSYISELKNFRVTDIENLSFDHCPIVDCGVTDDDRVLTLAKKLVADISGGEIIYLHCWGGHGRTGTLVSIMLHLMYGLAASECMQRCQAVHDLRHCPVDVGSPQTPTQREQVTRIIDLLIRAERSQEASHKPRLVHTRSLNSSAISIARDSYEPKIPMERQSLDHSNLDHSYHSVNSEQSHNKKKEEPQLYLSKSNLNAQKGQHKFVGPSISAIKAVRTGVSFATNSSPTPPRTYGLNEKELQEDDDEDDYVDAVPVDETNINYQLNSFSNDSDTPIKSFSGLTTTTLKTSTVTPFYTVTTSPTSVPIEINSSSQAEYDHSHTVDYYSNNSMSSTSDSSDIHKKQINVSVYELHHVSYLTSRDQVTNDSVGKTHDKKHSINHINGLSIEKSNVRFGTTMHRSHKVTNLLSDNHPNDEITSTNSSETATKPSDVIQVTDHLTIRNPQLNYPHPPLAAKVITMHSSSYDFGKDLPDFNNFLMNSKKSEKETIKKDTKMKKDPTVVDSNLIKIQIDDQTFNQTLSSESMCVEPAQSYDDHVSESPMSTTSSSYYSANQNKNLFSNDDEIFELSEHGKAVDNTKKVEEKMHLVKSRASTMDSSSSPVYPITKTRPMSLCLTDSESIEPMIDSTKSMPYGKEDYISEATPTEKVPKQTANRFGLRLPKAVQSDIIPNDLTGGVHPLTPVLISPKRHSTGNFLTNTNTATVQININRPISDSVLLTPASNIKQAFSSSTDSEINSLSTSSYGQHSVDAAQRRNSRDSFNSTSSASGHVGVASQDRRYSTNAGVGIAYYNNSTSLFKTPTSSSGSFDHIPDIVNNSANNFTPSFNAIPSLSSSSSGNSRSRSRTSSFNSVSSPQSALNTSNHGGSSHRNLFQDGHDAHLSISTHSNDAHDINKSKSPKSNAITTSPLTVPTPPTTTAPSSKGTTFGNRKV